MTFEDTQLRQALETEYEKLQKRVDARVRLILGLDSAPWEVCTPRDLTISELQAAIQRMRNVLAADVHGFARLWIWLRRGVTDSDVYDGRGLA